MLILEQITIFARRLREARIKAGLKQSDLAEKTGITAASISAYESSDGAKGKNPSLENAKKIASVLNVSLDWMCGITNENIRLESSNRDTTTLRNFLSYLVPLIECGVCTVEKVQTEIADYNPYTECVEGIVHESVKIEFDNYDIQSVITGIGKLVELRNSKLLPNEAYRISADGIMERSKYIHIDLNSGRVNCVTEFLDSQYSFDQTEEPFKL